MAENPNLPIGETTSLESDVTEIDSGMANEAKKTWHVSEFTDFFGLLSLYHICMQDSCIYTDIGY